MANSAISLFVPIINGWLSPCQGFFAGEPISHEYEHPQAIIVNIAA
jgi:hypothetical protein